MTEQKKRNNKVTRHENNLLLRYAENNDICRIHKLIGKLYNLRLYLDFYYNCMGVMKVISSLRNS